jgi:AcrR family transcriptional regulator
VRAVGSVNTPVYGPDMSDRLTKSDWLAHGLRTLARDGPVALRVEPMAKKLKVSRGSFYWHFRDLKDFHAQLLRSWQERSTDQVIADVDAHAAPRDRLRYLMQGAFSGRRNLDDAVRSWAAADKAVAKVVAATDRKRTAHLEKMLIESGVEPKLAPHRAAFLYWAYVGYPLVPGGVAGGISDGASDGISDLAADDLSRLLQT